MNAQKLTVMAVVLSFGLFTVEESALAQGDCKQVKAQVTEVSISPTANTGTVTNGGDLNGTIQVNFGSSALPTPDPTSVTFTGDFTITTNQGLLKLSNVYLYNFSGIGTVFGRVNPSGSTGKFAGATGVLFFNGRVTNFSPFTIQEELSGEICYAK